MTMREREYPPPCEACAAGNCPACAAGRPLPAGITVVCGCFGRTCDQAGEEDRRLFPEDYDDE